jgi:hypothetical protein
MVMTGPALGRVPRSVPGPGIFTDLLMLDAA